MTVSLSKNKKFFAEIQDILKQLQEGSSPFIKKKTTFDMFLYELLARKKSGTNELGGFSLTLSVSRYYPDKFLIVN